MHVKKNKFQLLIKSNLPLISEIKDVMLVDLLWQTIDQIDDKTVILDLLGKKIDLLLDDPKHQKNLGQLNLLDPKSSNIFDIAETISFDFQDQRIGKFQFRFNLKDLQKIILDKFPRLDYLSTNAIINYISDLFFDFSSTEKSESFMFKHRRYQEYFFARKLKTEYE